MKISSKLKRLKSKNKSTNFTFSLWSIKKTEIAKGLKVCIWSTNKLIQSKSAKSNEVNKSAKIVKRKQGEKNRQRRQSKQILGFRIRAPKQDYVMKIPPDSKIDSATDFLWYSLLCCKRQLFMFTSLFPVFRGPNWSHPASNKGLFLAPSPPTGHQPWNAE